MKICQDHCKKGLKTRKGPEFDSVLWENNTAKSQSFTDVCMVGGLWGGGGYKLDPTIQPCIVDQLGQLSALHNKNY